MMLLLLRFILIRGSEAHEALHYKRRTQHMITSSVKGTLKNTANEGLEMQVHG